MPYKTSVFNMRIAVLAFAELRFVLDLNVYWSIFIVINLTKI